MNTTLQVPPPTDIVPPITDVDSAICSTIYGAHDLSPLRRLALTDPLLLTATDSQLTPVTGYDGTDEGSFAGVVYADNILFEKDVASMVRYIRPEDVDPLVSLLGVELLSSSPWESHILTMDDANTPQTSLGPRFDYLMTNPAWYKYLTIRNLTDNGLRYLRWALTGFPVKAPFGLGTWSDGQSTTAWTKRHYTKVSPTTLTDCGLVWETPLTVRSVITETCSAYCVINFSVDKVLAPVDDPVTGVVDTTQLQNWLGNTLPLCKGELYRQLEYRYPRFTYPIKKRTTLGYRVVIGGEPVTPMQGESLNSAIVRAVLQHFPTGG